MSRVLAEYKIYYQNVRGLRTKTDIFFRNLLASNLKIVALTETNLQPYINSSELFPQSFNVYRSDRCLRTMGMSGGGGVLVALSNDYISYRVNDLDFSYSGIDCVWVKIKKDKGGMLYLGAVYIRPRSSLEAYQLFFDSLLKLNLSENDNVIIVGDFNLNVFEKNYDLSSGDNLCKELLFFLDIHDFKLKNNILNFQSKTLDLVITNVGNTEVFRADDPLVQEDVYHPELEACLVITAPHYCKVDSSSSVNLGYAFHRADFLKLYQSLREVDWSQLYLCSDIDIAVDIFYNIIYKVLDQTCPKKKIKKSSYPHWFTYSIIKKLKLKEKFHKRFKKYGCNDDYLKFKELRKIVKNEINLSYSNYIANVEMSIQADSRSFWQFVNSKKNDFGKLLVMNHHGMELNGVEDIVDAFKSYFSSVYSLYVTEPTVEEALEGAAMLGVSTLSLDRVTEQDVLLAIKSLKSSPTAGPDLLPQYFFKGCSELLVTPLTFLFNLSLKQGIFPDKWKLSKVIPIFKSGQRNLISNYRPISIISVVAKIFEVIIYKPLFTHVKNYITPYQHGFFPGRSTVTNLLNFTDYISGGLDSGVQTDVIYLDLAKAFDRVDHLILLKKLNYYGCSNGLVKFFRSYLVNRQQYIYLNGVSSSTYFVQSGVPQGSNLGPCLFLIMINDICENILSSKTLLFADDMKLFKRVSERKDILDLQNDLDNVFTWCSLNKMSLNISKCNIMSFSRARNVIENNYTLNNEGIKRVFLIKDLGIYMDSSLSFNCHVDKCVSSASRMLGFLIRQSVNFKNVHSLSTLYGSLVRSRLESGAVIWAPSLVTYTALIEKIQKRFLRFLYFKCFNVYSFLIPYEELCYIFEFDSLNLRREAMRLCFLFHLVRGRVDDSLILGRLRFRVPAFHGRCRYVFDLPHVRTAAHMSSPLISCMRLYNSILDRVQDIDLFFDPFMSFKRKVYEGLRSQA
jgi:hypothetical protein